MQSPAGSLLRNSADRVTSLQPAMAELRAAAHRPTAPRGLAGSSVLRCARRHAPRREHARSQQVRSTPGALPCAFPLLMPASLLDADMDERDPMKGVRSMRAASVATLSRCTCSVDAALGTYTDPTCNSHTIVTCLVLLFCALHNIAIQCACCACSLVTDGPVCLALAQGRCSTRCAQLSTGRGACTSGCSTCPNDLYVNGHGAA